MVISSCMLDHRVFDNSSWIVATACHSSVSEFVLGCSEVRVARSLVLYVMFFKSFSVCYKGKQWKS